MLKLYNTLTRKKESFKPINTGKVKLYACGPTVYWYAHIGNLRSYIFEDILKRTLEYNGYKVKHIINITDVGHLTSDSDTGEDKMEKGAKREKKSVWEIAEYYTKTFQEDIKKLNIKNPSAWAKVTDYIKEQIDLIYDLEKKGYTYLINDGLYFDTSRIKDYGKLWGSKKINLKAGARVEIVKGKKNITDFALWKLTPAGVQRQMEWNSQKPNSESPTTFIVEELIIFKYIILMRLPKPKLLMVRYQLDFGCTENSSTLKEKKWGNQMGIL